jgi:hypothetical protein
MVGRYPKNSWVLGGMQYLDTEENENLHMVTLIK